MRLLVLVMLIAATTAEFFTTGDDWGRWQVAPNWTRFLPEVLSACAALAVVLSAARTRFAYVRAQYWLLAVLLIVTIVSGIVVNHVGAGPVIGGLRLYLRAAVWFLIPAVFLFSTEDVRTQIKVALFIGLLQIPFAVQQRVSTSSEGRFTGDYTSGTLLISSVLSVFLISCICICAAMYARKRLSGWMFGACFVLLVIPTTINETKGTLVLLPIGLLIAFLAAAPSGKRWRVATLAGVLAVTFGAVFVPVYDHLNAARPYARPVMEKMTDVSSFEDYVLKTDDIGAANTPGRLDSIYVPFKRMKSDPAALAFGFGIGNVSKSVLGKQFVGDYFYVYGPYLTTSVGRVLMELGLLGVVCMVLCMWLVFQDSVALSRTGDTLLSAFGAGWVAVTLVMMLALLYKDLIVHESMSYLYWYFSGIVAAARMRITLGQDTMMNMPRQAAV